MTAKQTVTLCTYSLIFFNSLTQKIMLQVVSYLFRLVRFESRLLPSATNTTRDIFLQVQFYALPCVILMVQISVPRALITFHLIQPAREILC